MHVFVTGATGLIGRSVCELLLAEGHGVTALSRSAEPRHLPSGTRVVQGDPGVPGAWQEALALCDACVNLAGEPLAGGRWTPERKRAIRESRVRATVHIAEVIAERGPRVLVSGSAIGWYGSRGDEALDESAPAADDFLGSVSREWEAAAEPARKRARVVLVRTGIVLAPEGGALEKMALLFKLFAGGPIGDGSFWQSWIHLTDEVGLLRFALGNEKVSGPLNATAPEPVRNRDFARALGRVLHRPSLLPTPAFAVRLALGEMAGVVLASQRVMPEKALDLGYRFRFPRLLPALEDLLGGR